MQFKDAKEVTLAEWQMFAGVYRKALEHIKELEAESGYDFDRKQDIFEEVMEAIANINKIDKFWDKYNALWD